MKTDKTANDFMFIQTSNRNSADTIASELVQSGYVVKTNIVYKKAEFDWRRQEVDYYHIEFHKPKNPVFSKDLA